MWPHARCLACAELTPREVEVLKLIAAGLSNREIAVRDAYRHGLA